MEWRTNPRRAARLRMCRPCGKNLAARAFCGVRYRTERAEDCGLQGYILQRLVQLPTFTEKQQAADSRPTDRGTDGAHSERNTGQRAASRCSNLRYVPVQRVKQTKLAGRSKRLIPHLKQARKGFALRTRRESEFVNMYPIWNQGHAGDVVIPFVTGEMRSAAEVWK